MAFNVKGCFFKGASLKNNKTTENTPLWQIGSNESDGRILKVYVYKGDVQESMRSF